MCLQNKKSVEKGVFAIECYKVLGKLKDGTYVAPARYIKKREVYKYSTGLNTPVAGPGLNSYTTLEEAIYGAQVIDAGSREFDTAQQIVVVKCIAGGEIKIGDHLDHKENGYESSRMTINSMKHVYEMNDNDRIDFSEACRRVFDI